MTDQPPAKRPRKDSNDPGQSIGASAGAQPTINKSGDFWLDDGNILLMCESTGFRVHRGVLAMHSQVFKDMLAVGCPDSEQGFEGCPVVVLPDAAEDVLHILKALYYRDYPPTEKIDIEFLAPLLRMSTKYMLSSLRKEFISRLQILFPDTLDVYTSVDRAHRLPEGPFDVDLVIELGTTCSLPIILPVALYLSALHLQGEMRSAKGLLSPTDDTSVHPQAARFLNNWGNLLDDVFTSLEDQPYWKTLQKGRWECQSRGFDVCDGLPFEIKRQMETRCRRLAVNVMEQPIVKIPQPSAVCSACRKYAGAYERQLRGKLWDILPAACGYTSWDALRVEQGEDDVRSESS